MTNYRLSNEAKNDLIRIHHYGVQQFGMTQADRYFKGFYACFERIAAKPFAFEAVEHIKTGYRRCVCGIDSIFFRLNDNVVEIMAIVGRQDINQMFK